MRYPYRQMVVADGMQSQRQINMLEITRFMTFRHWRCITGDFTIPIASFPSRALAVVKVEAYCY